jgi:hypothetical protein
MPQAKYARTSSLIAAQHFNSNAIKRKECDNGMMFCLLDYNFPGNDHSLETTASKRFQKDADNGMINHKIVILLSSFS